MRRLKCEKETIILTNGIWNGGLLEAGKNEW